MPCYSGCRAVMIKNMDYCYLRNLLQDDKSKIYFDARFQFQSDKRLSSFYKKIKGAEEKYHLREIEQFEHNNGVTSWIVYGEDDYVRYNCMLLNDCKHLVIGITTSDFLGIFDRNVEVMNSLCIEKKLAIKHVGLVVNQRDYDKLPLKVRRFKNILVLNSHVVGRTGEQYFDFFTPIENESFVDAGALDGATTKKFINWCGEKYRCIYAFEPNPITYSDCYQNLKAYGNRIHIFDYALWHENCELSFDNSSSKWDAKIKEYGNVVVRGEKLDNILNQQLPKELLDEKYAQMYKEIETSSFMPKAVTKDNSVIPMQLNRAELEAILSNAKNYLPFLADRDSSGKTVSEKIIDIFKYRIPYYVGPLNKHSEKSWLVRTDEKIYPWNFENVVDADNSAEKFINNLTSKCTYLPKEDVIPKNSLLYSAFTVLNEINNIKIDGEEISVEIKQGIYKDLFEKSNKVKVFDLKKYLASNGYMNIEITGIDTTIKGSLKPFIDLQNIDLSYSDKEEIIKSVTIFGDDKKLLKNRLKRLYGDRLTADDIKKISKLKYTGWSRLSEKLLTGIEAVLPSTGEYTNIIHALWETNNNLMQLLSSNYDFRKKIDEENGDSTFTSLREEIDNLYVSPKIKRPIYQAMQIVEEIVKIQGHDPKKIFIEVARDEGEKKRTVSRKQKLIELYKYCKKDEQKLYEQLCNTDENDFRRDALYLYYTQLGKCMYTGKPIELSEIYNNNIYDIDHIFPRSKIKDDSLNNRVLVLKAENAKKGNIYPINSSIRNNMLPFWKTLFDKGLISKEKFERLVRNQPLTDEELSSFVSRQLVETRQSTKAVAQLLKKRYHDTAVEYIKASLVSDFRQENDFVKSRDVNDFHHAKDAYLNIVVGNVYTVRSHLAHFIDNVQSGKWSVNKMFDYTTNGAWIVENNKSINIVKSNMAKNNIRFTRYAFKQTGGLFDQNPLKKGLGQVPRKKDMDIDKYGGYNKPSSAYFAFVEYKNSKGEIVRSFEPVDLYAEKEYIRNPQEFIKRKLGVDYVKIIIPCVKYNALISINGFRMHISSKSSGGANLICKPAVQLVVSQEQEKYIKKISSYLAKCAELRKEKEITSFDGITEKDNTDLYETLKHKTNHTIYNVKFSKLANILIDKQCEFEGLSLYEQCYILMQIINILHANVMSGDLSAIGEAKKSGVTTISNKMQPSYKTVKLINQSISGLFEQEIDLLK